MKQLCVIGLLLIGALAYGYPEDWIGHHQSELIQDWGAPTKVTIDGKGGTILVYIKGGRETRYVPPMLNENGVYADQPEKTIDTTATYMFYVNPKGYIYYYRGD